MGGGEGLQPRGARVHAVTCGLGLHWGRAVSFSPRTPQRKCVIGGKNGLLETAAGLPGLEETMRNQRKQQLTACK